MRGFLNSEDDDNSNNDGQYEEFSQKVQEDLISCQNRAKGFIKQLKDQKDTPILESLVTYCKNSRICDKNSQHIQGLLDGRLTKMLKNGKLKKNWSECDITILIWFLSKYMEIQSIQSYQSLTQEDWKNVSNLIPGTSYKSCLFKFVGLKKFKLANYKWRREEEQLFLEIIKEVGAENWKVISERLYERNQNKNIYRTPKQCRQHWSCYLNPAIRKGPWERQEDIKLLEIVKNSGCEKKWCVIREHFEGRTENALKNRYNLLLEKQKKISKIQNELELIEQNLRSDSVAVKQEEIKQEMVEKELERETILSERPSMPIIPQERRSFTYYIKNESEVQRELQPQNQPQAQLFFLNNLGYFEPNVRMQAPVGQFPFSPYPNMYCGLSSNQYISQ